MTSWVDSPVFVPVCGFPCRAADAQLIPQWEEEGGGRVKTAHSSALSCGDDSVVNPFQHPQGQL